MIALLARNESVCHVSKVYEAVFLSYTRDFKQASSLFLEALATFTASELFPYRCERGGGLVRVAREWVCCSVTAMVPRTAMAMM